MKKIIKITDHNGTLHVFFFKNEDDLPDLAAMLETMHDIISNIRENFKWAVHDTDEFSIDDSLLCVCGELEEAYQTCDELS